ncbi:MAG: fatty acid desaturase family protein [Silicimonas sp.]|nr:fatty acid desaturase family protein [Silicimonas sp.]
MVKRDYDLLGPGGARAVEIGLAAAEWYHTEIPRAEMKALMERRDGPAIRDTAIYYGAMIALAALVILLWPSPWALPVLLAYGVLYASGADSRWHEAGHRTAFKTRWMNKVVYQIACFMLIRNPVVWRWSHSRHHTDTIIVGRDPEIITMRPPDIARAFLLFLGSDSVASFFKMFRYARQGPNAVEASFIPVPDQPGVARVARIWIVIYVGVLGLALWTGSILPLLLVGGPVLYGSWHYAMTGLLQHTGLADNVIDHRLNTRTVLMNPVSRFIYWNMNYHVEHHMFPMVPYHALPALHARIAHDLPPPNRSIGEAWSEMFGALMRQVNDPEYRIEKTLPPGARPYRKAFHADALRA